MGQAKETLPSTCGNFKDGFDLEELVKQDGWLKKVLAGGTTQQMDGLLFNMNLGDENTLGELMQYEYGDSEHSAKPWVADLKGDLRMTLAGILLEPRYGIIDRLADGQKFETVMNYMTDRMKKDFIQTAKDRFNSLGIPNSDALAESISVERIKSDSTAKNTKIRDPKSGLSGEYA